MTTTMQVAGTLLRASSDDRVLTYLLAPFGEAGRTNLGKVKLTASSITVPEDVTGLPVNVEHDPRTPVGKFVRVEATAAGYEADVRFLATRAGDDALTEAREGVRRGISVEVDNPVVRNGRMLAGVLSGAAVCVTPAYPSAQLVAADAGELPEDFPDYEKPSESSSVSTDEITVNGVTYVVKRTSTSKTEVEPKTPAEDKPSEDDAAQAAESETDVSNSLTASAAAAAGTIPTKKADAKSGPTSVGDVARMLASAFKTGGDTKLLATLADITHDDGDNDGDGLGEITAGSSWLGQVWTDAPYERQFIPLIANGTLTSWRENGFTWATKPVVATYGGNKADVPSTGLTATPVNFGTKRWANAADIDRRYLDFGDSDLIQSFIELNVDSYKEVTDLDVAAFIAASATTKTFTAVSGVNNVIAAIVKGALALIAARRKPSFAIVGIDVYEPLLYLTRDEVSVFLTESFGLKNGLLDDVTILPTSVADYAGNVVIGDGRTLRFKELGDTPVRVEAENVANGGRDIGVFGYTSNQVLKAGAVLKYDVTP